MLTYCTKNGIYIEMQVSKSSSSSSSSLYDKGDLPTSSSSSSSSSASSFPSSYGHFYYCTKSQLKPYDHVIDDCVDRSSCSSSSSKKDDNEDTNEKKIGYAVYQELRGPSRTITLQQANDIIHHFQSPRSRKK